MKSCHQWSFTNLLALQKITGLGTFLPDCTSTSFVPTQSELILLQRDSAVVTVDYDSKNLAVLVLSNYIHISSSVQLFGQKESSPRWNSSLWCLEVLSGIVGRLNCFKPCYAWSQVLSKTLSDHLYNKCNQTQEWLCFSVTDSQAIPESAWDSTLLIFLVFGLKTHRFLFESIEKKVVTLISQQQS